jgi:hypothetical protein
MSHRRLVVVDLGIATAHTVRVLDGEGTTVAKRKAWPAVGSLTAVEAAALAGWPAGTRLEVVIEPTGPAWLPIAVSFSPPAGTRCSGSRRRRPLTCAGSCPGTPRPTASTPTPWPGCRWSARPGCSRWSCPAPGRPRWTGVSVLTGDLGAAGLAVLEGYADPRALARAGQARLTALNHQGLPRLPGRRPRPPVAGRRPSLPGALRRPPAIDFTDSGRQHDRHAAGLAGHLGPAGAGRQPGRLPQETTADHGAWRGTDGRGGRGGLPAAARTWAPAAYGWPCGAGHYAQPPGDRSQRRTAKRVPDPRRVLFRIAVCSRSILMAGAGQLLPIRLPRSSRGAALCQERLHRAR